MKEISNIKYFYERNICPLFNRLNLSKLALFVIFRIYYCETSIPKKQVCIKNIFAYIKFLLYLCEVFLS